MSYSGIFSRLKDVFFSKREFEPSNLNQSLTTDSVDQSPDSSLVDQPKPRSLEILEKFVSENKKKFELLLAYCKSLVTYLNLEIYNKKTNIEEIVHKFQLWDIQIDYILKNLSADKSHDTQIKDTLRFMIYNSARHMSIRNLLYYQDFMSSDVATDIPWADKDPFEPSKAKIVVKFLDQKMLWPGNYVKAFKSNLFIFYIKKTFQRWRKMF